MRAAPRMEASTAVAASNRLAGPGSPRFCTSCTSCTSWCRPAALFPCVLVASDDDTSCVHSLIPLVSVASVCSLALVSFSCPVQPFACRTSRCSNRQACSLPYRRGVGLARPPKEGACFRPCLLPAQGRAPGCRIPILLCHRIHLLLCACLAQFVPPPSLCCTVVYCVRVCCSMLCACVL
jgi:hypothetical protein